jgi:hypothetical protein
VGWEGRGLGNGAGLVLRCPFMYRWSAALMPEGGGGGLACSRSFSALSLVYD